MLLSESDREIYFPSVQLTGAALTGAIWKAQSTAETIASRSLDVKRYEETVTFSNSGQTQLKYVPIVASKGFDITLLDGQKVKDYELDADEGLLTIHYPIQRMLTGSHFGFGLGGVSEIAFEAKVVYFSGFNPDDNDPRAIAAKLAVASILNYQTLT
jgi:hypothetical protein